MPRDRTRSLLVLLVPAATGGLVEEHARRVEGYGAGRCRRCTRSARQALAPGVQHRVDDTQLEPAALVLHPRHTVEQRVGDGDESAGEEALVELVVDTEDGDGRVAADAATLTDRERVTQ